MNWPELEKFLKSKGQVRTDIIDLYQVNFFLDEVKITFYSNSITTFSEIEPGFKLDKITLASVKSIGAMKLEVMSRRNLFRDYYDIYSILKEGISLKELVSKSSRFSQHRMKTKGVLGIINTQFCEYLIHRAERCIIRINKSYSFLRKTIHLLKNGSSIL